MAELFTRSIFFNGSSDIDQLAKIFAVLGTPDDLSWPGRRLLPDFLDFEAQPSVQPLAAHLPSAPPPAVGMLAAMLQFASAGRPSAARLAEDPFWAEEPIQPREKLIPPGLIDK